jgi:hypothetical protein
MDNKMSEETSKLDLPAKLEFENGADATGLWFAAAAVFAVIAAGVILYRTANLEIRTASNDVPPAAAQSNPTAVPQILPQR